MAAPIGRNGEAPASAKANADRQEGDRNREHWREQPPRLVNTSIHSFLLQISIG